MKPYLTRQQIRELAHCPVCYAAPGDYCTHKGRQSDQKNSQGLNHYQRMEAAQYAVEQKLAAASPGPNVIEDDLFEEPNDGDTVGKEKPTGPEALGDRPGYGTSARHGTSCREEIDRSQKRTKALIDILKALRLNLGPHAHPSEALGLLEWAKVQYLSSLKE